jgi:hypothetical protein
MLGQHTETAGVVKHDAHWFGHETDAAYRNGGRAKPRQAGIRRRREVHFAWEHAAVLKSVGDVKAEIADGRANAGLARDLGLRLFDFPVTRTTWTRRWLHE